MSATRRNWIAAFYWIGVGMTVACIALVIMGSSEFVHRFEHNNFPVSWVFAGIGVLAFLAAELCTPAKSLPSQAKDEGSQLEPEPKVVREVVEV